MQPELKKLTCLSTILKEGLSFNANLCSFSEVSLAVQRTLLLIFFFLEPVNAVAVAALAGSRAGVLLALVA